MNGSEAACHGLTVFGKEIIWCYLFTEDNENCLLKIFGGSDTFRSQIATVKHSILATGRRVSNTILLEKTKLQITPEQFLSPLWRNLW